MRFIERTERVMYLIEDPEMNWIVLGVIPGCGSTCNANLAQVLLEFIMSCEGLDQDTLQGALRVFVQKNVAAIVEYFRAQTPHSQIDFLFDQTLGCLLRSLGSEFELESDGMHYTASFDDCPICGLWGQSGIRRHGELGHEVLFDLFKTTVHSLNPAAHVRMPEGHSRLAHGLQFEIIRPIG
jgi:hypothetical protein